jgi:hypothetical protein
MASIIKANQLQDFGGNSIITSDGSGTITLSSGMQTAINAGVTSAANTPAFVAYKTSNQTISNTSATKITFEAEQVDSGSVYDTSNSRFTPGETGYYWIGGRWRYDTGTDFDTAQYRIYKNGSIIAKSTFINQNANGGFLNMVIYAGSTSDYYEMYGYQNSGGSLTINGDSTYPEQDQAQFYAFKIIGL